MLKKLLEHKEQFAIVCVLIFMLACVRAFEDCLFYDPLLHYFKANFTALPLPKFDLYTLSAHLFFRYTLNTLFSLGIIYTIYRKMDLVKFAAFLYALLFIILIMLFYFVLAFHEDNKMLLFYVRRFIIQPLFLLLFVPAFYFQERASAKNNIP